MPNNHHHADVLDIGHDAIQTIAEYSANEIDTDTPGEPSVLPPRTPLSK